ncbi:MAG TPA: hypothetical protein VGR63_08510 [Casimicrobiaceae bacterium]|jgi:hypothetical protein|nr:hypothetical protein [Casimicrobiaceae bacterium]
MSISLLNGVAFGAVGGRLPPVETSIHWHMAMTLPRNAARSAPAASNLDIRLSRANHREVIDAGDACVFEA